MTISIICPNKKVEIWRSALTKIDDLVDVQIWPNEENKADVTFALCWNQPENIWQDYPNLKVICSMGAGVDHLLKDRHLPANLPIIRIIDPALAQSMFEYILTATLYFHRNLHLYAANQKQQYWCPSKAKSPSKTNVGVLGLGKLGGYSAKMLAQFGFNVSGWSRSKKMISGVVCYSGSDQLEEFSSELDVLICLLPLTDKTRGILNQHLFRLLKKHCCLINVARGEHLVDEDLVNALEEGQLAGAFLDVFHQEPLSAAHPFWGNEKIVVTPHCSSITNPHSVATQIIDNYYRLQENKALINQVDIHRGY